MHKHIGHFFSGDHIRELLKKAEIYPLPKTNELEFMNVPITKVTENELRRISFLMNPKDSVAVCYRSDFELEKEVDFQLVLDGIQDPGNMGTIIRLADWFGIQQIICSEDTVDYYNPKVVQASMGSFTRVNILYKNLEEFLSNSENVSVGTDMVGTNIYEFQKPEKINLVLGNEGNGIRPEIEAILQEKVSIPRFGISQSTESLNVSIAGAIILGQLFK